MNINVLTAMSLNVFKYKLLQCREMKTLSLFFFLKKKVLRSSTSKCTLTKRIQTKLMCGTACYLYIKIACSNPEPYKIITITITITWHCHNDIIYCVKNKNKHSNVLGTTYNIRQVPILISGAYRNLLFSLWANIIPFFKVPVAGSL